MSVVKKLSPAMINLIAAGEVVQGPWSIVKELIENSIDAGASRIEIDLTSGGIKEIVVADDGSGMTAADLILAVERHATSKIETARDLDAIITLGFRGEALSAISGVSKMTLRTRRREDNIGSVIQIEGGNAFPPKETSAPPGTTIITRDLFFNTPARKKFLSSKGVEGRRAVETFKKVALAQFGPAFKLTSDGRLGYVCSANATMRERIGEILGWEILPDLIPFDTTRDGLELKGYLSRAGLSYSGGKIFILVNGRPIKGGPIYRGIVAAYDGRQEKGRYPAVVLYITLNPRDVDVNVHPTKDEVKFTRSGQIYTAVFETLRDALNKQGKKITGEDFSGAELKVSKKSSPKSDERLRVSPDIVRRINSYFAKKGLLDVAVMDAPDDATERITEVGERAPGTNTFPDTTITRTEIGATPITPDENAKSEIVTDEDDTNKIYDGASDSQNNIEFAVLGQVDNKYILVRRADGLLILDQHTAHERIIYERLTSSDEIKRQTLLIPDVVEVKLEDKDLLIELLPELNKLGFDIMPFGGNTFIIKSHPVDMKVSQIGGFINEVIDDFLERGGKPNSDDRLHRLYASISCRAAVMAGQRMSISEMTQLVNDLFLCKTPNLCPHGRPTMIEMAGRELDKLFGRI